MVYTVGANDMAESRCTCEADPAIDILNALRMEEETQPAIVMVPTLPFRERHQQHTEYGADDTGDLVEPIVCRISSNLKVAVLSTPDTASVTAVYLKPGHLFSATARVLCGDRIYFKLPGDAGYVPLHSRRDPSKIVVDQECSAVSDLNPVQLSQHSCLCTLPEATICSLLTQIQQPGIYQHELKSHAALRLARPVNSAGSSTAVEQQSASTNDRQQEDSHQLRSGCSFCRGVGCIFCQRVVHQAASAHTSATKECTQQ